MGNIIDLAEEGKIKRYFRTRDKHSFEGAITHVTQHASGAEPLFLEESDYLYMLHLMKEVSKRFRISMLSFVLMLNHIHLLIKLMEANLASAMKNLFQAYAMYFNRKYERKGHVFCGAYRSSLCFDESYLLASSLYIHRNPVEAGLVINPADYRWSSCALFLNEREPDSFIDYRFVLGILDDDIIKARREYGELLENLSLKRIKNVFEEPKALENIVRILKRKSKYSHEKDERCTREHGLLGDEDLDRRIEGLKNKSRLTKPQDLKARRFLIEQLKARGFDMTEIAQKLNLSRQGIYKALE